MDERVEVVGRVRWMALCRGLHGEPFVREEHGGVFVVPVNARGEVLLVVEPAVTDGTPTLGLPAGAREAGESPAETADREMQEEIGYRAGRLDVLAELHPLARHADWRVHAVLARDLTPSAREGDEPHPITVEPVPLARFETLIDAGRLLDSTCIAALFLARRLIAM